MASCSRSRRTAAVRSPSAGETRPWREGEAIIFDDSLEHWVAFDAEPTAQRIVLVVDVPHPDLRDNK